MKSGQGSLQFSKVSRQWTGSREMQSMTREDYVIYGKLVLVLGILLLGTGATMFLSWSTRHNYFPIAQILLVFLGFVILCAGYFLWKKGKN